MVIRILKTESDSGRLPSCLLRKRMIQLWIKLLSILVLVLLCPNSANAWILFGPSHSTFVTRSSSSSSSSSSSFTSPSHLRFNGHDKHYNNNKRTSRLYLKFPSRSKERAESSTLPQHNTSAAVPIPFSASSSSSSSSSASSSSNSTKQKKIRRVPFSSDKPIYSPYPPTNDNLSSSNNTLATTAKTARPLPELPPPAEWFVAKHAKAHRQQSIRMRRYGGIIMFSLACVSLNLFLSNLASREAVPRITIFHTAAGAAVTGIAAKHIVDGTSSSTSSATATTASTMDPASSSSSSVIPMSGNEILRECGFGFILDNPLLHAIFYTRASGYICMFFAAVAGLLLETEWNQRSTFEEFVHQHRVQLAQEQQQQQMQQQCRDAVVSKNNNNTTIDSTLPNNNNDDNNNTTINTSQVEQQLYKLQILTMAANLTTASSTTTNNDDTSSTYLERKTDKDIIDHALHYVERFYEEMEEWFEIQTNNIGNRTREVWNTFSLQSISSSWQNTTLPTTWKSSWLPTTTTTNTTTFHNSTMTV